MEDLEEFDLPEEPRQGDLRHDGTATVGNLT
jgi:hypothetical protein